MTLTKKQILAVLWLGGFIPSLLALPVSLFGLWMGFLVLCGDDSLLPEDQWLYSLSGLGGIGGIVGLVIVISVMRVIVKNRPITRRQYKMIWLARLLLIPGMVALWMIGKALFVVLFIPLVASFIVVISYLKLHPSLESPTP